MARSPDGDPTGRLAKLREMETPSLTVRRAHVADLPSLVPLFRLPDEGTQRDLDGALDAFDPAYVDAMHATTDDNALFVAEVSSAVVGVFQLTFVRHVAYRGGLVAQIENVIVLPAFRGRGIGSAMMRFAIDRARARSAFRIQLTSNKRRTRAHVFYARLGFESSHEGMKLTLGDCDP
jgi:GNAT superfamily N-acetyltransferase